MDRVPLSARLSQMLVAFTLELDNTFEQRFPHRTTVGGGSHGPWLTSWVMWANYLRLVPPEGVPLAALGGRYGLPKLSGLQRWGYLTVEPAPGGRGLVRPTAAARAAAEVWEPLPDEIEQRWRHRLGDPTVDSLRAALLPLARPELPRFVPVLRYGLFARASTPEPGPPPDRPDLSVLLSWAVGGFTEAFEDGFPLSLALCADVLRAIDGDVAVGELPAGGGVSAEAVAMATGFLVEGRCASLGTSGRTGTVSLTSKGSRARGEYVERVAALERDWSGRADVDALHEVVAAVLARPERVAEGLEPHPDGWRAQRPYPHRTEAFRRDPFGALPHQPMVLHRGGFPDGA